MPDQLNILLIDDDDVDRTMVRRALASSGVRAEFAEAADGRTGLAALQQRAYDCALLDHGLPDLDGLAVLQAARVAGVTTPIILLTGHGDEQLGFETVRAGASDYLSKNRLSRELLAHSVRHVVRLHRAQAEAQLARGLSAESEQRFRLMADSAPVLLWVSDEQARAVYFNQGWLTFTGRPPEQELGEGWREGVHPDDRERLRATRDRAAAARERFETEFRLRRHDGAYRWLMTSASPRLLPDGTFAGYVGSCVDITERRAGEQDRADLLAREQAARAGAEQAKASAEQAKALAEASEQRYRFLAESIPQQVWTAWPDGRLDYISRIALEYFGLDPDDVLGDAWQAVVHPDDAPECQRRWAHSLRAGEEYEVEFRLRRHDGAYRWHLGRAVPLRDAGGQIIRWFGTNTDIDDQRRHQEALRFLAEASVALASSMDYETTLAAVAKLAVPQVGDWCAVDLIEQPDAAGGGGGTLRRIAVEHADRARVELAEELLRRHPPRAGDPFGIARVARTGRPELYPHISDAQVDASTADDDHASAVRTLGLRSSMAVPLVARGRAVGVISFATTDESGRHYGPEDLALAEDLARRAAAAVDNAALYRRAQDAVRAKDEANALLDTLLEKAPVGFAFFDRDLRYVRVNEKLAELHGVPAAAHVGRSVADVLPGLGASMEADLARVRSEGRAVLGVEVSGDTPAEPGAARDFIVSYYPVRAPGADEPLGVGAVVVEITDRKRAEQRLRDETRTTEALHRIGGRLAQELDAHRLVQTVTDEATSLTGAAFGAFFYNMTGDGGERYTLYTISGVDRSAFERFPMPRNTAVFGPTFRGEGVVRYADVTAESHYGVNAPNAGMPEGHLPVRSYLAAPVVSRSGEVLGGLFFGHPDAGVFTDRDERLVSGVAAQAAIAIDNARLYEALRASEQRFRVLAEGIPQLVWSTRADGYCDYLSSQWVRYTGVPEEAHHGDGWAEAIHPDDRAATAEVWHAAVADRAPYDCEYRLRRHDGAYRWFQTRGVPLRDGEGRIVKWFGTSTDIHDRKGFEQELREARDAAEAAKDAAEGANAAKDQFLAVLSHELRTPLTPVLSTVQALESEPGLPAELRDSIEMIKRNVELEARLIDDLLDLTRVARGKLELNLQAVDAHQAMRHAIDICRDEVGGKGLRVHADLSAARPFVRADSARLQQVFWNLIKNAVKFTPAGGNVWIRTANVEPAAAADDDDAAARGEPARLLVEVRDSGIGIQPHILGRIFDAFEQGGRSITQRFGGLGLGLAISRALIDMQGGRLSAASEGKDKGATFTVELATVDAPAPAQPDREPPAAAAGRRAAVQTTPLRILLVDDHEDTARAMARLLNRLGHKVTTAHTMAEALAAYDRDGGTDLLISDIGLPDGSGLELMRTLHGRPAAAGDAPRVCGIALSGFGMEEDVRKSKDAGFFDHLTKPINFQKLEAVIRAAASAAPGQR